MLAFQYRVILLLSMKSISEMYCFNVINHSVTAKCVMLGAKAGRKLN